VRATGPLAPADAAQREEICRLPMSPLTPGAARARCRTNDIEDSTRPSYLGEGDLLSAARAIRSGARRLVLDALRDTPNLRMKQPLWRTARVPLHRLTVTIFFHRSRCAAFECGGATRADSLGRHKPNGTFAARASCSEALALDVLEEGALLGAIDLPKAEIVLVYGGHCNTPPGAGAEATSAA